MVRDLNILASPSCTLDLVPARLVNHNGIEIEESPVKDKVTFKHHLTTTDDVRSFSESVTKSSRSSSLHSFNEDTYELASALSDESKKEFCLDMCRVFHGEFQLTFGRYFAPNRWILMPLDADGICRLPPDTFCNVQIAKVRFECDLCRHCWTSMRGQISFFYDCESDINVLYFKLFTQNCDYCGYICNPLWYPEEVCRVMRNVFVIVNRHKYPNLQTPIELNHCRRFGNPKGRHHGCESCRDGVCVSVAAQQLGYKLA